MVGDNSTLETRPGTNESTQLTEARELKCLITELVRQRRSILEMQIDLYNHPIDPATDDHHQGWIDYELDQYNTAYEHYRAARRGFDRKYK